MTLNLNELNPQIFLLPLENMLSNNLPKKSITTLANMLALDYYNRLNSSLEIKNYAMKCAHKLKNYLKNKIIINESFSTLLELFTIIISPDEDHGEKKDNILTQEQIYDVIVDLLIAKFLTDVSPADLLKVKSAIKELLTQHNNTDIINYISSEPDLVKNLFHNALNLKEKQNQLNQYIITELDNVLNKTIRHERKVNLFIHSASKLATALSSIGLLAIGAVFIGPILPFIIIPATILSLKYAPTIGEKIGERILNIDADMRREAHLINELKSELRNKIESPLQQKHHSKSKTINNKVETIDLEELSSLKNQINKHKSQKPENNLSLNKKSSSDKGRHI